MDLEPVSCLSEDGRTYEGVLATPGGTGRHPAVLVAHEAPGLLEHSKRVAKRLADAGFVAFAFDYIGEGRVLTSMPGLMEQVGRWVTDPAPLGLACRAAHDTLKTRADVDATRIAGFGYCFGGQALVEYGPAGADLLAIVGFHPGMSINRPDESPNIRAKLLMLLGSADPITSAAQRIAFEEEMDGAGVTWRMVVYGGAPHSFTNEDAGDSGIPGVAYDAVADAESWTAALRFLDECGMRA